MGCFFFLIYPQGWKLNPEFFLRERSTQNWNDTKGESVSPSLNKKAGQLGFFFIFELFLFFNFKNRLFQNLFPEYESFDHAGLVDMVKQYWHITHSGSDNFI